MSISWIRSLYKHCEPEVPMTICAIVNDDICAYTLTRVIDDMEFDFNKCTSWDNPYTDVILDSNLYLGIVWVQLN